MKLATVTDVRNRRKSLSASSGADEAITDALHGATTYLEEVLNTQFKKIVRSHFYNVNLVQKRPTGQYTELFLKAGFVDTSQSISVKIGSITEDLVNEPDLIVDQDFVVNKEDGIILLDHRSLINSTPGAVIVPPINLNRLRGFGDQFLARISYTAGLTVDTTDTQLYILSDDTDWLKEAAVIYTLISLDTQSPVVKPEFADKLLQKNKPLWATLNRIINKHERYFGTTIKPLFDI